MRGHGRPKDGVASLAYDPRISIRKAGCPPKRDGRDKPGHDKVIANATEAAMLEKTGRTTFSAGGSDAPLMIRRVDAIPVALPLKAAMKMAGETITAAHNILVRIEAGDGTVGWGEAASAPTMTGD